MSAPAPLTVRPGPPLGGEFRPPGDKSITHRAFLLGLLAEGESVIRAPNPGADCAATLCCAEALGARVTRAGDEVRILGTGGVLREPGDVLDCGNSGTTLRLLSGVLAGRPFLSVLTGDDSLRARPVDRVVLPLRRMGARLAARAADRLPPLVLQGGELVGTDFAEPTASAQVASAILLAALAARGETRVTTVAGVRDHTPRMLGAFGVEVGRSVGLTGESQLSVRGPAGLRARSLRVPGDFSAAAFFLAAAAAIPGARVTARDVSLNPTRLGFCSVLERMGAIVERRPTGAEGGEPVGEVSVEGPPLLLPVEIGGAEVPMLVDEVPAWCIVASAANGTSRLVGARELRLKESDRLAALAGNLEALGVQARELPDGLEIRGGPVRGGRVRSFGDHRIAMALAVLGTRAAGSVTVDDASSVATSFPSFVATLGGLGGRVGMEAEGA